MVPQAAAVAGDFDIITYSAGGFNGLTDKYETASRLARQDRPCIVLHCGDWTPRDCRSWTALAEDVDADGPRHGPASTGRVHPGGVTEDQVS